MPRQSGTDLVRAQESIETIEEMFIFEDERLLKRLPGFIRLRLSGKPWNALKNKT